MTAMIWTNKQISNLSLPKTICDYVTLSSLSGAEGPSSHGFAFHLMRKV